MDARDKTWTMRAVGAIELSHVVKRFGDAEALKGLCLSVSEGEVMVLLGHNGAGKTVTVRLISTMTWPTSGTVRVCGLDTRKSSTEIRRRIGVCLDAPSLWPRLSGREHVNLMADAHKIATGEAWAVVNSVLDRLDFALPQATSVENYSLGMKRKLGLALSLLHRPSLLVWDEPEIGLDAASRVQFRGLINDQRRAGTTVLLTTHALDLAEQLADRIAVLSHGRVAAVDTVQGLRSGRHQSTTLEDAFLALLSDGDVAPPVEH